MRREKEETAVPFGEGRSYGIRTSAFSLALVCVLGGVTAYSVFAGHLHEDVFGKKNAETVSIQVDEKSGGILLDALHVYAKENPDASVMTENGDGSVSETPEENLAGIVTDEYGNAVGVLVDGSAVENEAGERIGAMLPDGTFIDGADGVTAAGDPYYHVVWGDTLCTVSSTVHYSVQELAEYNHISNVNLIYAESDLRIPVK